MCCVGTDNRITESGLECSQWLPRKLRITVLMLRNDKRRAVSEIVVVVADSCGKMFSAFAYFYEGCIGPDRLENRNGTRMRSVVAQEIDHFLSTVTGAKLPHVHSVSPSSRQPPTPLKSRFNFPDRLNPPKLMQRPKAPHRANWR
jgi:hypothetical protein